MVTVASRSDCALRIRQFVVPLTIFQTAPASNGMCHKQHRASGQQRRIEEPRTAHDVIRIALETLGFFQHALSFEMQLALYPSDA